MKKKILLLWAFLGVLSIGCSKQWCNTRYPPSVDSIYKEIIRDSIVVKDTTIYIDLPGEVVHDSIEIPCPDPGPAYIPKRVYAETSLARASAWWSYPVIKLELVQKDTTIERRLAGAIKESYYWKSLYEKLSFRPEPVKYIPGFYKFCTFAFIGIILAIAGYVALRLFVFKN
jgi:hypothetical protein